MRTMKTTLTAFIAVIGLAVFAHAGDNTDTKAAAAPKEMKHQTTCPVMGGKIDSSAYTDIQGQRVYHCCPACTEKLVADPDKYFKAAAAEGIMFENIQDTCPLCNMKLDNKSIATDFEGRHIAFCSDHCRTAFSKDPQKVLKKMSVTSSEAAKTGQKSKEMHHDGHDGHDHGHDGHDH